jgi:hypothetical protein
MKSSVSMTAIGFGGSGSFTTIYKRENRRSGFLEMIGRKGFSSLWGMVSSVVAFENIKSFCSTSCFLYLHLNVFYILLHILLYYYIPAVRFLFAPLRDLKRCKAEK